MPLYFRVFNGRGMPPWEEAAKVGAVFEVNRIKDDYVYPVLSPAASALGLKLNSNIQVSNVALADTPDAVRACKNQHGLSLDAYTLDAIKRFKVSFWDVTPQQRQAAKECPLRESYFGVPIKSVAEVERELREAAGLGISQRAAGPSIDECITKGLNSLGTVKSASPKATYTPPPQEQGTVTITLDVRDARILRDVCARCFTVEEALRECKPGLFVGRQTSEALCSIYDVLASVVPR